MSDLNEEAAGSAPAMAKEEEEDASEVVMGAVNRLCGTGSTVSSVTHDDDQSTVSGLTTLDEASTVVERPGKPDLTTGASAMVTPPGSTGLSDSASKAWAKAARYVPAQPDLTSVPQPDLTTGATAVMPASSSSRTRSSEASVSSDSASKARARASRYVSALPDVTTAPQSDLATGAAAALPPSGASQNSRRARNSDEEIKRRARASANASRQRLSTSNHLRSGSTHSTAQDSEDEKPQAVHEDKESEKKASDEDSKKEALCRPSDGKSVATSSSSASPAPSQLTASGNLVLPGAFRMSTSFGDGRDDDEEESVTEFDTAGSALPASTIRSSNDSASIDSHDLADFLVEAELVTTEPPKKDEIVDADGAPPEAPVSPEMLVEAKPMEERPL